MSRACMGFPRTPFPYTDSLTFGGVPCAECAGADEGMAGATIPRLKRARRSRARGGARPWNVVREESPGSTGQDAG